MQHLRQANGERAALTGVGWGLLLLGGANLAVLGLGGAFSPRVFLPLLAGTAFVLAPLATPAAVMVEPPGPVPMPPAPMEMELLENDEDMVVMPGPETFVSAGG